jgi:hypothetical protein
MVRRHYSSFWISGGQLSPAWAERERERTVDMQAGPPENWPTWGDQLLGALAAGGTIGHACMVAGVARTTLDQARRRVPALDVAIERVRGKERARPKRPASVSEAETMPLESWLELSDADHLAVVNAYLQ